MLIFGVSPAPLRVQKQVDDFFTVVVCPLKVNEKLTDAVFIMLSYIFTSHHFYIINVITRLFNESFKEFVSVKNS